MAGLTPKQAQFVREYLIDLNATQAAIRAGYSAKTAYSIAEQNLRKLEVKAAIDKAMETRAERTQITADRVLEELALVGFFRLGECLRITPDGEPYLDLSGATPEQLAAIAETQTEDVIEGRGEDSRTIRKVKVKFHDKLSALEKIGKHLGMFKDRVEHSGPGGEPVTVNVNLTDFLNVTQPEKG